MSARYSKWSAQRTTTRAFVVGPLCGPFRYDEGVCRVRCADRSTGNRKSATPTTTGTRGAQTVRARPTATSAAAPRTLAPKEYVAQPRTNPPSAEPEPLRLATPSTGTDHDRHRPPPSRAVAPAAASPTHNPTPPPARRQGMTANAAPGATTSQSHPTPPAQKPLSPLGRGVELSLRCPTHKGSGRLHCSHHSEIGTRR